MRRAALLVISLLGLLACPPRPDPLTREHQLEGLGLTLTLPGDWRGGRVGDGYIFTSHRADCTVTFDDGLVGIPMTEAGTRTFLVERLAAKVESTRTLAFGKWPGAGGVGTTATTRNYFGQFSGPRGAVWVQLTTRGRTQADADALWEAVTTGVR